MGVEVPAPSTRGPRSLVLLFPYFPPSSVVTQDAHESQQVDRTVSVSTTDLLTLALVLITGFYAWATFRILRANENVVAAMREQTEAQFRPYITVSVFTRPGTNFLLLSVKNSGKSPAINLTLSIDCDFYFNADRREDRNLRHYRAFSRPIGGFSPNAEIHFHLGTGHAIFGAQEESTPSPLTFAITARYEFGGKSYDETTPIDLHPFYAAGVQHDPVAHELEKLRQVIERKLDTAS